MKNEFDELTRHNNLFTSVSEKGRLDLTPTVYWSYKVICFVQRVF